MENLTKVLESFKSLAESATKLHEQALENISELESLIIIDLITSKEYDTTWCDEGEDGDVFELPIGEDEDYIEIT